MKLFSLSITSVLLSAALFVPLQVAAVRAATVPESLDALLESLGTQWKVHEEYAPQWIWDGTWTREGKSHVFVVRMTNLGSAAQKIADFKATAESYTGGILKLTHPNGSISVTIVPNATRANAKTSWCQIKGCDMYFEFSGSVKSPSKSLTGAWVHSADPSFHTDDSKAIVIQDGNQVIMTRSWKANGRWMVQVCRGTLSGNGLRAECDYAPGGNPFGFPPAIENWQVSQDWDHLDGTSTWKGGGQESHFSRIR